MNSLDMSEILMEAYDLADLINESEEVSRYLELRQQVEQDEEAQRLIQSFQRVKDEFEEAQRFGIFHPNYHEAKEKASAYQQQLKEYPVISAYLTAEEELDRLLHRVSRTIARTVSKSIKVPKNQPIFTKKSCG